MGAEQEASIGTPVQGMQGESAEVERWLLIAWCAGRIRPDGGVIIVNRHGLRDASGSNIPQTNQLRRSSETRVLADREDAAVRTPCGEDTIICITALPAHRQ